VSTSDTAPGDTIQLTVDNAPRIAEISSSCTVRLSRRSRNRNRANSRENDPVAASKGVSVTITCHVARAIPAMVHPTMGTCTTTGLPSRSTV